MPDAATLIIGAYGWATACSVGLFIFTWKQIEKLWSRLTKLETNHIAHLEARLARLESGCNECPHSRH